MATNKKVTSIIAEEIKKSEIIDKIKNDKDFEKIIKKIVSDVISDMYRVLWQHNGIFKSLGN